MTKRPKISDDLDEYVRRLHEEYTGDSAGNFEEALETVTQLAEEGIKKDGNIADDWYPGKYAGMVVDSIINDGTSAGKPSRTEATQASPTAAFPTLDNSQSEQKAVFKSYLQDGETLSVPRPEVDSIGASEDDLLQVIAYRITADSGNK